MSLNEPALIIFVNYDLKLSVFMDVHLVNVNGLSG